ncbi:MAG: hypothetical protein CM1200mP27_10910 [Chloroflexota bacterium]|nr:MAG: hypothetical protein CM1200mP27_10910 [Chloroflexota bacterium]
MHQKVGLVACRVFVIGPDMYLPFFGRVDANHASVRFDVALMHQLGVKRMLKNQVGFNEPLVNVSLFPRDVGKGVLYSGRRLR